MTKRKKNIQKTRTRQYLNEWIDETQYILVCAGVMSVDDSMTDAWFSMLRQQKSK